ncbi:MAG: phosphoribosylformylglycinamidine cyclo-ligase [Kiritimatiellae bacterium]|nr:phosphoribosylformylglycinamidine cyclo-ligase [Kiritimatiellia bacterium]
MATTKNSSKSSKSPAQARNGAEAGNVAPPAAKFVAYAAAGVDIDSKMAGIQSIKQMVAATATKGAVGGIGSFGGLFAAPGQDRLLVASTDGVGTKLKVACLAKRHDTVGQDLVNHCVNDILVQGAEPLFFMDYIGASRFDAATFHAVVHGLCKACRENGCTLLGGETAEMPGLYPAGEYDLVGTIVGAVEKRRLITGAQIRPGDAIIGLASGGLQTNGFSLARKVIFDQCGLTVNDSLPGTRLSVADALLALHRSFLKPVQAVRKAVPIQGMAHITGGGFVDNIPRVLPDGCRAVIDRASWTPPTLFTFIERQGRVSREEMYRVFNMGIGYVLIVRPRDASPALAILKKLRADPVVIGVIEKGPHDVVYRDK